MLWGGDANRNPIPRADFVTGFYGQSIDLDFTVSDQGLQATARTIGELATEEDVEPLPGISMVHREHAMARPNHLFGQTGRTRSPMRPF